MISNKKNAKSYYVEKNCLSQKMGTKKLQKKIKLYYFLVLFNIDNCDLLCDGVDLCFFNLV